MKILLIIISFLCMFDDVFGQQTPANSLYHNMISYYNPAFTAMQYTIRGGIQYRNQWVGIDGTPTTYFGQYEQDLKTINSGIGVTLIRDEIGFSSVQSALINYRYELKLSRLNRLSFGISGGANHASIGPIWITSDSTNTELPSNTSQMKFTMNAGVLLTLNRFKLGMSLLQLNQPKFDQLNYRGIIHYLLTLDYQWLITQRFSLEPAFFFISDGVFMSTTGQVRANYTEKYWAMIGYRSQQSLLLGIGTVIKNKFSIGYNLDISRSKLNNSGTLFSHGVYFNFQLKRETLEPLRIIGTPDF